MMCVVRARVSVRAALPLVAAAASADGVYALLAGAGVLAAARAGISDALAFASVGFLLLCAYLLWPRDHTLSARSAVLVAAVNPPAALLWLALSGSLSTYPPSAGAVVVFCVGAASATAIWFALVATASRRLLRLLSDRFLWRASATVSVLLVALACERAASLFA
jgi:arginine exporter protein ArgO